MAVVVLRRMTPPQVRAAVDGFNSSYVADWEAWQGASRESQPAIFGRVLRRWQATRPRTMRRTRSEARHEPPYLEDLMGLAQRPLSVLSDLTVSSLSMRTRSQADALTDLWDTFGYLTTTEQATCVGISKAILLVTNGRIGPALDSNVRQALGVTAPVSARQWLEVLDDVCDDIAAFERVHGLLRNAVSPRFARLESGRLYDMVLGPR